MKMRTTFIAAATLVAGLTFSAQAQNGVDTRGMDADPTYNRGADQTSPRGGNPPGTTQPLTPSANDQQTTPPGVIDSGPAPVQNNGIIRRVTNEVEGTVQSVDTSDGRSTRVRILDGRGQVQEYTLDDGTAILRDQRNITPLDIRAGDRLTLRRQNR